MSKKKNSGGGRYLAQKSRKGKGWLFLLLAVLCIAVCIFGFLYLGQEQPEPVATTAPPHTTLPQETTESPTEVDPLAEYRYIFERYQQAVSEKWDMIACEENNICYMVMFREDLSSLGYCLIDLNGDGQQELIISDGNVIYDLYASVRGHMMWVLSGGERNSYQLTADNRILNRGSNGAASFLYNVYSWDGAKLVTERSVFFNAMQEDPWVTTVDERQEVLTEDEAMALIESYQQIPIPMESIP